MRTTHRLRLPAVLAALALAAPALAAGASPGNPIEPPDPASGRNVGWLSLGGGVGQLSAADHAWGPAGQGGMFRLTGGVTHFVAPWFGLGLTFVDAHTHDFAAAQAGAREPDESVIGLVPSLALRLPGHRVGLQVDAGIGPAAVWIPNLEGYCGGAPLDTSGFLGWLNALTPPDCQVSTLGTLFQARAGVDVAVGRAARVFAALTWQTIRAYRYQVHHTRDRGVALDLGYAFRF